MNLPTRNNNPGDLRDPATGSFRTFPTSQAGFDALKQDLQEKMTGNTRTGLTGNSTLQDFSSVYAPASDKNDPIGYAQKLAKKLGVDINTPISNLSSRLDDFASAIADNEGFQGNRVSSASETIQPMQSMSQIDNKAQPSQRLTREQMTANIDAMEKQGASQQEIQSYLDSLKGQTQGFNPSPYSKPTTGTPIISDTQTQSAEQNNEQTLGQELSGRVTKAGSAISKTLTGEINPLSGLLQTVGAVAGGISDIASKGLELIPGVKNLEGWIGEGVQKLAQTEGGKSIIQGIGSFAAAHPEMADDISAIGNIAGVALLATGTGKALDFAVENVGKVIGKDAVSTIAKDVATQATKDMAGTLKTKVFGKITQAISEDMLKTGQIVQKVVPKFAKLGTYTEKISALQKVLKVGEKTLSNEERVILENVIQTLKPKAMEEIGSTAFSRAHPVIRKAGGLVKNAIKHPVRTTLEATGLGTLGAGMVKGLLGK